MFKNLRKLYGRTSNGTRNRKDIKISITPETMQLVERHVEFGKGKYGSSLFEFSVRVMLVLLSSGEDIEHIAKEISEATDSPYLVNNLRMLARYLEA